MPLSPGDRIERYVIESLLGAGGMGEVYRARDERLQRSVALKILRAESPDKPSTGPSSGDTRMLREARAAAALEHPNVVAVFDVGQVEAPAELRGMTYLAMELIRGAPLRRYVRDPSVPMYKRVRWLREIAEALAAAHAAGLVHRDIKPENVMVRDDGRVKVLDFGVAKRAANAPVNPTSSTEGYTFPTVTGQGVVVGTPLYMAPEQLRAEPLDGRADQFAWGVVAYELLTGKAPWSIDGGAIALVAQILSSEPAPLSARAEVPPRLADVVARAMSKDPAARFPSMDAIVAALSEPVNPLAATMHGDAGSRASLPDASPPAQEGVASSQKLTPKALEPAAEAPPETKQSVPPPGAGRRRAARWMSAVVGVGVVATAVFAGWRLRDHAGKTARSAPSPSRASPPACSSRACAAAHGGEPWVCRKSDGACVAIASEDCKPLYEQRDLDADDTVWIGGLFPATGPSADSYGAMNLAGAEFARKEIAQETSVLQGAQRTRGIALVACDDTVDAKRAAVHLVDDVGVPAVLGFGWAREVLDVGGSLLIPRRVLAVSTITPSPLITRLPQPPSEPRLVWSTAANLDGTADTVAHVVPAVFEPMLRARPTRVAVVRDDTPSGVSFADVLYRNLVFNGRPALDNGRDYEEIVFDPKRLEPEVLRVGDRVAALHPSIVVILGGPSFTVPLVERVERSLAGKAKPVYISANDSTDTFAAFIGKSADLRHRIFAVNSLSNSTPNARFVIRYNEAHVDHVTRFFNPGCSYDGFYLLAYAAFALRGEPARADALARAFGKLVPPGREIEVGPGSILDAVALLSSGESIDLRGTQSALDFDLSTGLAPVDYALLCPALGPNGEASGDVESGVVYHSATHATDGTMRCP